MNAPADATTSFGLSQHCDLAFGIISLYRNSDLRYQRPVPRPMEGRIMIVAKRRAQDAMAAAGVKWACSPDETLGADGEVVWSWRRDPGVNPGRPVLAR